MNGWAILVAAVLNFAVAMVWYLPKVFGTRWMAEVGLTDESAKARGGMALSMGVGALSALVMAAALDLLIGLVPEAGLGTGLWIGILAGLVTASAGAPHAAFGHRKRQLYLIDFGYSAAAMVLMGAVLGAWR